MKKKEGEIVDAIPAPSRTSKSRINWDDQVQIARLTGRPVLAGTHIAETQAKALRQRDRYPFRDDTGHIFIALRNSQIEDDGRRYGDLYFEWVPTVKKED